LNNFEKVLTGHLDAKLFELKFKRDMEDSTQSILFEGLRAVSMEDWKENMLLIVGKMFAHTVYEFDTVVTFIWGEYRKPTRKRDLESEVGGDDEVYSSQFILCSLNKTDQPKKTLLFDYVEKEFKSNNAVDPIINLESPLLGFLFPAFNDNSADVNHILYYAGKVNQPNGTFIEEVSILVHPSSMLRTGKGIHKTVLPVSSLNSSKNFLFPLARNTSMHLLHSFQFPFSLALP
jgi:hypothetical protein